MKRNEVFSIFRFMLVLKIVAFHFAPRDFIMTHTWISHNIASVTYFFVLSGFLLIISSFKSTTFDSLNFISKRLSRLMPQYYMALVLVIPFAIAGSTPLALFLDVFFLQSWVPSYALKLNGPAWFMSCLASCFVFFPAIFHYIRENKVTPQKFLIGALILWAISQLILTTLLNQRLFYIEPQSIGSNLIKYFPLSHFSSFVLGAALGYIFFSAPQLRPRKLASLFFFITACIIFGDVQFNWSGINLFNLKKAESFYAPMFGFLVFSIALLHEDFQKPFNNRLIRYLGDISFPVYIFQLPVVLILSHFVNIHVSEMHDFVFYLFILIGVACIFQSFIQEKASKFFLARIDTMARKLRRMAAVDG
jgi:peptidoglycan/LPS O-acetylase OafA/YrhL